MIFVSISLALSVCSYSDSTDNSLRALSKLFMCKSCTDNFKCSEQMYRYTYNGTHAKDRPSSLYKSEPVHGSSQRLMCVVVLFHVCESRSVSYQLKRCNFSLHLQMLLLKLFVCVLLSQL